MTRPPLSYARATAATAALVGLACWVGFGNTLGIAPTVLAFAFCFVAWRRGVLRSQALVTAEVTCLVVAVILKLVFLDQMPATPLPVLAGVLLVQCLAQLGVDLRAFGADSDATPPVTYPVCYAAACSLAFAAACFRVARTESSPVLGVVLSMLLSASFFLLAVVWWDWTTKAFSSLKMAVTLLSLIVLGSVVGAVVIQHAPTESAKAHYERFMNGEGAAPVNARYLFSDPAVEWSADDEARRVATNEKFGDGEGERWAKRVRRDRATSVKDAQGRQWVRANADALRAFFLFCERTQMTRVFTSWHFNALLVLLALTVCGVMVRRFPYERRDVGWVAAHAGIVLLLCCYAGSNATVRDGFVELAPTASPGASGAPTDASSFDDIHDRSGPRELGWTLRLVRTSADWHQALVVAFVGDDERVVAEQECLVLAGKAIELERTSAAPPRYRVEIVEVHERSRPTFLGFRPGKGSGVTALRLRVEQDGKTVDRWIADDVPLAIPGGQLRFLVANSAAEADVASAPTMPADMGAIGFVRVAAEGKELARIPATTGAKSQIEYAGKTWRLVVGDTLLDERLPADGRRLPIERQYPKAPAASVTVEAAEFPALEVVVRGGDAAKSSAAEIAKSAVGQWGLRLELEFIAPLEVRIVAMPDGSLTCVEERRGSVSVPRPLRENDAPPIPFADGQTVSVGALVRDAEEDVDVSPLAPETDADYMKNGLRGVNEQTGVPAVKVRISEPGAAPYEKWVVGADPWGRPSVVASQDRRLRLQLVSTSESVCRSAVQAIDADGNVLGEHVVRANSPCRMRGYAFHQDQFVRPDRGGPMSVFRLTYDPFAPWTYAGFVLVAVGVVVLLWLPGRRAITARDEVVGFDWDRLVHSTMRIVFPLLTVGVFLGCVWRQETSGTSWGGDVKETLAFIAWLASLVYFHLRPTPGMTGTRSVLVLVFGGAAILVTWLCMHLLPASAASL